MLNHSDYKICEQLSRNQKLILLYSVSKVLNDEVECSNCRRIEERTIPQTPSFRDLQLNVTGVTTGSELFNPALYPTGLHVKDPGISPQSPQPPTKPTKPHSFPFVTRTSHILVLEVLASPTRARHLPHSKGFAGYRLVPCSFGQRRIMNYPRGAYMVQKL